MLPMGEDTTKRRLLTKDYASVGETLQCLFS